MKTINFLTKTRWLVTIMLLFTLCINQMRGAGAISVTSSAITLPKGSTTVSTGDWINAAGVTKAGSSWAYSDWSGDKTIGSYGSITFTNAGDMNTVDLLQFKKQGGNISTTISSPAGVDIVIGYKVGNNSFSVSLTGAAADVSGSSTTWSTMSISTTNTSATLTITKTATGAGYVSYITITPKSGATCSNAPTVTAGSLKGSVSASNSATAQCTSGISNIGGTGCSLTSYGFAVGTSSNPTIGGTLTSGGKTYEVGSSIAASTGFEKLIDGLSAGTKYYVRPYATNGAGTAYGTEFDFTTLHEYTLTFKEYVGGATASGSPSTGKVIENATSFSFGATAPSKTGYKIEGFYTDQSANSGVKVATSSRAFVASVTSWTDKDSKYTKGANANLYVNWQAKQAAITFDKNSGTGGDNGTTATYGSAMPTVSVPTRAGYNFDGYYDAETDDNGSGNKYYNANGTSAANWNKDTEAATTLYAKWTPKTLNITWDANGVSWSGSDHGTPSTTVTYGSKIATFPTSPAKAQCDGSKEFVGWTLTPIVGTTNTKPTFVSPQTTITETGDFTLYAVFATKTANSFTKGDINDLINGKEVIIHNADRNYALSNSGSSGRLTAVSVTPSTNVISSSEASIRWIVQNNGTNYYFKSSTNYLYASSAANTNLYCGATLDYWTIGSYNSAYYLYSNTSTSSYKMEAYYSNTNGAFFTTYSQSSSTPGADYQMQFYVPTYSAYQTACCSRKDITKASSGSVTGGSFVTSVASACEGASVTLTATPGSKEYVFNAWTVNMTASPYTDVTTTVLGSGHSGDNPATMTMPDYAVTVNAAFSAISSIAVKTAPTKTTYCAGEYFDPTGLVITATYANSATQDIPYAGNTSLFTFSPSTSTALTSSNTSVSITVYSKSTSQSITVNTSHTIGLTGSGTVTGGTFSADESSACVGATITLTPSASTHYTFTSWTITKAGGGTVTPAGNTFTMPDENVTVNATFTEDAHHYATFKNDLKAVSGYDKVKVYDGNRPTPPTLTDGDDACDKTECTLFYGWLADGDEWEDTKTDISDYTIYRNASSLPVVSGADVTYHAVWAKGTAAPTINSTLIAKWDKQSLTASTAVKAKDKDGNTLNDVTMTSNTSLGSSETYTYYTSSISAYPEIVLTGFSFSSYSSGSVSFIMRGSAKGDIQIYYKTSESDYTQLGSDIAMPAKNQYTYEGYNIPNSTTHIKIKYCSNTGNFYFGTVRIWGVNASPTYTFTELNSTNTSGWTTSDWDGYYIIGAKNSTNPHQVLSSCIGGSTAIRNIDPSDGAITTGDVGVIFKVTYSESNSGYCIQSMGTNDYLGNALENSTRVAPSFEPYYHYSIGYNSIRYTSDGNYIKYNWNSGSPIFGSYASGQTDLKLYTILSSYSKWRISCCEKNDINKDGTPAGTVTGGTFTTDKTSACEGATITLSVTSTSSGYNFDHWEVTGDDSDNEITVTDNKFTMPDEAVTVTAVFETAHTTTVTLNAQGGSGGTASVTATVNLPMPSATMPTRSGYTFGGFYGASGGSGTQYYAADGSSANNWDNGEDDAVTIYAKWTASGYTVTLNNMSATTGGTSSVSVTYGASTNLTTAITCPEKTNKVFGGYWTSDDSGTTLDTKLIDEDGNWLPSVSGYTNTNKQWQYTNNLTLYAKWSNVSYTNYRTTCGPEITVSGGPVYLTTCANCEVLTTGNITVSSTAWGSTVGAPKYLRFSLKDKVGGTKYAHSSSNISSSEFRVYNSSGNGGSYADGSDFVIPTGTTGSASYTFRIAYKPTAGVYNTRDHYVLEVEVMDNSATKKAITMETMDLYGRTLPEEFAIAVKKDDQWYALPNDLASTAAAAKAVSGIPIVVDNETTPTSALYAPENVLYKGAQYYGSNNEITVANRNRSGVRFTRNGSQYLQVSTTEGTNTMWLSTTGGTDVQDWYLNSETFNAYTVKIDPRAGSGGYKDKKMGMSSNGNFGFYASPTSADIYFLPVEGELKEASVVEWGKNSLIVEADAGTYSKVIARVGSTATGALTLTQTRTSVKGSTTAYNYTVNLGTAIDLSTKKGQILYLDWLDGSGDVKGASMVTIPWIIAQNNDMYSIDETKGHWETEVHVLPGYTLEVIAKDKFGSDAVTVKNLEIYPGATVKVTSGTLTATNLVLRNGWTRANGKSYDVARLYIDASANMAKPSNAYADWYIDFDQYYPIAVPWEVDLGENNGSKLNYLNTNSAAIIGEGSGTSVRLRYYDGESRATNGQTGVGSSANWKLYGGDDNDDVPSKLVPGKGYAMTAKRPTGKAFSIIRMPLSIPSADWTTGGEKGVVSSTHKDQVTVKAWGVSDESKPRYIVGWNFIANPYMAIYQGAITHSEGSTYDIEHVNIPDIDFKEFGQYAVGALGQKLLPASGFLIQAEKDGTLTFGASNRKVSAPSYRNETAQVSTKQKAYITLDGADAEDMMGLLISERYTADYDINGDLQKLLSDGNTLRAWMNYINMNLAYVAVNEELAKEWIPVSVRIPETGEYTFRMHEASISDELEGVYLIDYQTDVTTNLMYDSYTFTAEAGTNTERFAINAIVGERKVPTSMDVTGGDVNGTEPVKFIWHDKVYILHNNVIYDSTGKRVNVINK